MLDYVGFNIRIILNMTLLLDFSPVSLWPGHGELRWALTVSSQPVEWCNKPGSDLIQNGTEL